MSLNGHVAERVLLHVEEPGRLRRPDRLERVQQRPAADEQRRRDADVGVHLGQELERLAAGLRIERRARSSGKFGLSVKSESASPTAAVSVS